MEQSGAAEVESEELLKFPHSIAPEMLQVA